MESQETNFLGNLKVDKTIKNDEIVKKQIFG